MRAILVVSFLITALFFGLQSCNPTEPEPNPPPDTTKEYTKIDAFTSATKKLRVDSVLVYHDRAVVYWWEFYKDDAQIVAYRIEWGKDSTNFTDTLQLRPFQSQTVTVTTISNLEPNTEYYAQFYRDWHGTVKKTHFGAFPFKTRPAPKLQ